MALVQVFSSGNMHDLNTVFGSVTAHDSSHIVITAGALVGTYFGNFSYDGNGNVFGTLTGFTETFSSLVTFDVTGLNMSANAAAQLINSNQIQAFLQSALAGNDRFTLAPGTHLIDGYGGYNTATEQTAFGQYKVSNNGSFVSVTGASTNDTLYHIQGIYFADGFYNTSSGTFSSSAPAAGFVGSDVTTNRPAAGAPEAYSGPVAGLQKDYISTGADSLTVSVTTDNWFIHTGSGTDAVAVHGGTNVLDGGTGSNFLTGGNGVDTFFLDDRIATADLWSTVVGFHGGDAATVWGVTPQDFALQWLDNQGAAGFSGLTLGATAVGKPNANLTLAGYSSVDLSNGRLSVTFGTDAGSGSNYMLIQAH